MPEVYTIRSFSGFRFSLGRYVAPKVRIRLSLRSMSYWSPKFMPIREIVSLDRPTALLYCVEVISEVTVVEKLRVVRP